MEVADDQVTAVKLSETDSTPMTWREVEVEVKSSDPEATELLGTVGKVLREAGARPSASGSKLGASSALADPSSSELIHS